MRLDQLITEWPIPAILSVHSWQIAGYPGSCKNAGSEPSATCDGRFQASN